MISITFPETGNVRLKTRTGDVIRTHVLEDDDLYQVLDRLRAANVPTTNTAGGASKPAQHVITLTDHHMVGILQTGVRIAKKYDEREMTIGYIRNEFADTVWTKVIVPPIWWIVDFGPGGGIDRTVLVVELEGKISAWPFANVNQHVGTVCWGSGNSQPTSGTIEDVDSKFFGLPFNHHIPMEGANEYLSRPGRLDKFYTDKNLIGRSTIKEIVSGTHQPVWPIVKPAERPAPPPTEGGVIPNGEAQPGQQQDFDLTAAINAAAARHDRDVEQRIFNALANDAETPPAPGGWDGPGDDDDE